MTAKVLSLASAKGGTGKTVLTATFGNILASVGKKVLLIDTDAATNGLSLFYLHKVVDRDSISSKMGLFETKISGAATPLKINENLDLIPTTYRFQNTETVPFDFYEAALRNTMAKYRDHYDYIFLDTQAGSDQFARVALSPRICDNVVIVSEYDPMSAAGIERLKALFSEELAFQRTWILLNKLLPDFVRSFSEFLEVARYLTPIPWNADVVRAYARQRLALDLIDGNEYTFAAMQALAKLLRDKDRDDLEEWLRARVGSVRKSLDERIHGAQVEVELLKEQQADYRRTRLLPRTTIFVVAVMVIVAAGVTIGFTTKQSNVSGAAIAVLASISAGLVTALSWYGVSGRTEDVKLQTRIAALENQIIRLEALRDIAEQNRDPQEGTFLSERTE
jgi:chromosome partitioning protein